MTRTALASPEIERAVAAQRAAALTIEHTLLSMARVEAARRESVDRRSLRMQLHAEHAAELARTRMAVAGLRRALRTSHRQTQAVCAALRIRVEPRGMQVAAGAPVAPTAPQGRPLQRALPGVGDGEALPHTVRLALTFIHENAHRDITAADIAAAAFVTVRATQIAFRKHLDIAPLAYVRWVRVVRAHEELTAPAVDRPTSVTEVAERWHFSNSGRFSQYYRQVYGELPSETLRQMAARDPAGSARRAGRRRSGTDRSRVDARRP